jgi:TIR domain
MAYVTGLANDVVISYAHADNTEGWVDQFHDRLLNKLRTLERGAPFTIWRDRKLTGADVFSDEIFRQFESSGILISILSPNGLDASWCQQERERFERAVASKGGFRLGEKIRAIKVTKTPCAGDKHREVFATLGYEFYRRSQQTSHFTEFHPSSPDFDALVLEIAQEVYDLLQLLRARLLKPEPDLAVYVAAVTSDLESWRTGVVDQLAAWNCRVYSEGFSAAGLSKTAITESLSACSFSVHCVGAKRGVVPEDETLPIDVLQLECARTGGVNRIVCQIGQPHEALEEALKQATPQGSEELIRPARPDVFLQFLEDRVKSLRKAGVSAPGNLPTVYVVCSLSEWNDALRLKSCLEAEHRFAAVLPIREVDDASARLRDHRETLKSCDAVLVYWDATSKEAWFREKQREVIGARQKRRASPLPAFCLSSSPYADPAAHSRPDLPLQQVPNLECSNVRRSFSHLETAGNGDRK